MAKVFPGGTNGRRLVTHKNVSRLAGPLPDFRDLLAEFNAHGVEYLVVGAHALAAYRVVRATKDFDVWVRPSAENVSKALQAISAFGPPFTISP